jgi:hypothetical protein
MATAERGALIRSYRRVDGSVRSVEGSDWMDRGEQLTLLTTVHCNPLPRALIVDSFHEFGFAAMIWIN